MAQNNYPSEDPRHEAKYSQEYDDYLAERERIRQKVREAISNGLITLTSQYEASTENQNDDPAL